MTDHDPTLPPGRAAVPKRRLDPATPETIEVEGHGVARTADDPSEATPTADDATADDPEVTGQMHPDLAKGYAEARQRDMLTEAERDRRSVEARTRHEGGRSIRDRFKRRSGDGA